MNSKAKACTFIILTLSLLFCRLAWAIKTDLVWSTFLGGSFEDKGHGIAVDDSGNVYVAGTTESVHFPITSGVFDTTYNGGWGDAFLVKLDFTGSTLRYATFLGGDSKDYGRDIALDNFGNAYVTGYTESANFPTTSGAFDTTYNGFEDAYVVKLNATGSALDYATFLGGEHFDKGFGIALDNSGNAFVTGTGSSSFPTTPGAFNTTSGGIFVTKLNSTGSTLDYSTFLGEGSSGAKSDKSHDVAVDISGNAYVTGETYSDYFPVTPGAYDTIRTGFPDVFVAKLNAAGSDLVFATYLGGSSFNYGRSIAVDSMGSTYLTGDTWSDDFPTTAGAFDTTYNSSEAFVVKFNVNGTALDYSTLLGGRSWDVGYSIKLDGSGSAYIAGYTFSDDFPCTPEAFDETQNGGYDLFVTKLNPTGSTLEYSSLLGGKHSDGYEVAVIAVDASGNAYLSGATSSDDFPVTLGAYDTTYNGSGPNYSDVFVAKMSLGELVPIESTTPIPDLPQAYYLLQNYPNPFNENTKIHYQIPRDTHVTLKVFNNQGQMVQMLVNADQTANQYQVSWDGRNDRGQEVASGIYFCQLKAGDFGKAIKLLFLR